jgi:hypothetical protein
MKLAKTITIIVLSVMLALSTALNIFIFAMFEINDAESFKQALLCRELANSMSQLSADNIDTNETVDTYSEISTPEIELPAEETEVLETAAPDTTPEIIKPTDTISIDASTIYNENGIKIMLVEQELSLLGPSLKFYIENNTDKTLDIRLTDVYIDGFKADYSSLYCDSLRSGKKAYDSLTIWESDFEDYTEFPSVVQFVVMIQDSESWNVIAETEHINICLE